MSQSKPARSVRRRCARKARSNKAVGHQPQRTELVVDTCGPSAVTAVDPAEGQIDYVRRKPVPARSSVRAALLRLRRAHRGKRFFQCVNLRLHGGELRT
jgi:hypothetical protein